MDFENVVYCKSCHGGAYDEHKIAYIHCVASIGVKFEGINTVLTMYCAKYIRVLKFKCRTSECFFTNDLFYIVGTSISRQNLLVGITYML